MRELESEEWPPRRAWSATHLTEPTVFKAPRDRWTSRSSCRRSRSGGRAGRRLDRSGAMPVSCPLPYVPNLPASNCQLPRQREGCKTPPSTYKAQKSLLLAKPRHKYGNKNKIICHNEYPIVSAHKRFIPDTHFLKRFHCLSLRRKDFVCLFT